MMLHELPLRPTLTASNSRTMLHELPLRPKPSGQRPRQRTVDAVIGEIVDLRRRGFRFVALADENFYPVTLDDLAKAARRAD